MFQLGIFRLEDYCPQPSGFTERVRWALIRNRISLRLLKTAIPASPREVEVFEALMQGLRLNAGIHRFTLRHRFQELDRSIAGILTSRFAPDAPLEIRDWAASDCLTSAEWAAGVLTLFPKAHLEASDLTLMAIEVSFGPHILIQERDGQPLQYISPSFVVNVNRPEQRPRLLTRWLIARAQPVIAEVRARLSIPPAWLDSESETLSVPPFAVRKLPMVHPDAVLFRAQNPRFSIARHSVFDPSPRPVDVLRSMNIYNLSHFAPPRLTEGARAVWLSLRPGGIWIVGRTWQQKPPLHNVSVFERTDAGFRLLQRVGEGSEIESLVLAETFA